MVDDCDDLTGMRGKLGHPHVVIIAAVGEERCKVSAGIVGVDQIGHRPCARIRQMCLKSGTALTIPMKVAVTFSRVQTLS